MFPKIVSNAFIDDSKELKILKLSDWSFCRTGRYTVHEEMHWRFPIACNVYNSAFRIVTFVPFCRFHFSSDCNEISSALEP